MRITVWSSLIFHPKSGIRKFSHLLVFFSSAPCHFVESRILQKLDFSPSKIFPIEFPWAKDATLLQGRKSCLEASWVFMRFSHRGTAVMDFYEKKMRFFPWFSNYLFVVGWGFGMVLTFFLGALMFDVENWNFTLVSYNYSIPGSTFQNCCKLLITVTAPWKNPSKWWRKLKLGSCK